MSRRLPNNYGGITKLSGKRKNPFMVYVNQTVSGGVDNPELYNQLNEIQNNIGSDTPNEILKSLSLVVSGDIDDALYDFIETLKSKCEYRSVYKKIPLGYFPTYKDANIFLADYNKTPYDPNQNHTFAEIYEQAYKDAHIQDKSKSSQNAYNTAYNNCSALHGKSIRQIKLNDLQAIIDTNNGKSKSHQNNIVVVMHLVYDFALKHDLANKDYSKYVKINEYKETKKKTIFTPDEIKLLWQDVNEITVDFKMCRMLLIMIYTGVRIGEILNIRLSDISGDIIHVRGTKTKVADRLVPVHPDIQPLIDLCISENKTHLIESLDHKPMIYKTINNHRIDKLNDRLNMNHTCHETRHSFATYSLGMDPVIRSYIIGHSNNNITDDLYTHPDALKNRLRSEITMLNPVLT